MYKRAAQLKIRFQFHGRATVEDLFDLSLVDLDALYRVLKGEEQPSDEGLLDRGASNEELSLKLAIVKDVFQTKMAELQARESAAEKKAQKQRIMEIIARKQEEDLHGKSLDELQAMINEL